MNKNYIKSLLKEANNCVSENKGKTEKLYKRVLKLDKENIEALFGLAEVLYFDNKYKESLKYIKKVLKINGNHAKSLILNADIYFGMNEYKKAISFYNKALKNGLITDSDKINCYMNLGEIYYIQGNNRKTINYLNKALQIGGSINEKNVIYSILLNIYIKKEKYNESLIYFKKLLDLYNNYNNILGIGRFPGKSNDFYIMYSKKEGSEIFLGYEIIDEELENKNIERIENFYSGKNQKKNIKKIIVYRLKKKLNHLCDDNLRYNEDNKKEVEEISDKLYDYGIRIKKVKTIKANNLINKIDISQNKVSYEDLKLMKKAFILSNEDGKVLEILGEILYLLSKKNNENNRKIEIINFFLGPNFGKIKNENYQEKLKYFGNTYKNLSINISKYKRKSFVRYSMEHISLINDIGSYFDKLGYYKESIKYFNKIPDKYQDKDIVGNKIIVLKHYSEQLIKKIIINYH